MTRNSFLSCIRSVNLHLKVALDGPASWMFRGGSTALVKATSALISREDSNMYN